MDFAKKPIVVIYIDNNKILFYFENTKQTLQLDIPPNVISNLDLISKEQLGLLIDKFIQTNNLKHLKLDAIIVFSQNSAFEKDFPQGLPKDKEADVQKFIDIVPFEDVLSKNYVFNKKIKVVAINRALFEAVLNIFKQENINIFSIVPFSVLQELNTELSQSIDLAFIAAKANSFTQYSLISENEKTFGEDTKKTGFMQKQNIRVYVLTGIFLILLLVLVVLVITTLFPAGSPQDSQVAVPTSIPTPTIREVVQPTIAPETQEASVSATITPGTPVASESSF